MLSGLRRPRRTARFSAYAPDAIEREHPIAARILVERAARQQQRGRRVAESEPHLQRLAAADVRGRTSRELEVHLELTVLDLRIHLRNGERVRLAVDRSLGRLPGLHARDVELVDLGRDLVVVHVVDLTKPLGGLLRLADLDIERRELARDRRLDHEAVEVRARDREILLQLLDAGLERRDLREPHPLVLLLRLQASRRGGCGSTRARPPCPRSPGARSGRASASSFGAPRAGRAA